MPDINETRAELENYFKSRWTATEISYDNLSFDDDDLSEFVQLRFSPYSSDNVNVGSQNCKHIRHEGTIAILIYTRINTSTVQAYNYASLISDIMSNKPIARDLYTTACNTRRNGEERNGWYGLIVRVPFVSDEF